VARNAIVIKNGGLMETNASLMNRRLENLRALDLELDLCQAGKARARNGAIDGSGAFDCGSNIGAVCDPENAVWIYASAPNGVPELNSPLAE
jgi:hypothetical protein